jgi:hypothetical protein
MPSPGRRRLEILVLTVAWLLLLDMAVGLVVDADRPWSPRIQALARFFDYGRSIEGKLERAIGPRADRPNAIVSAGWIDPRAWRDLPTAPAQGADLLVAVYGQSFAFNAADAMARLDGHVTLRRIGGPAAPPSHSYAAYRADAPLRKADVVVVGILASSLAHARSISALSWTFESPAPYTYPRFDVREGELAEVAPALQTEADFRHAFAERGGAWQDFMRQLRAHDEGFDRFAFGELPWTLDGSVLVRLLRRGWVAHRQQYRDGPHSEVVLALLRRWKARASEAGERFVVVLLQDRTAELSLDGELASALAAAGIRCVSSERLFSSTDPANFQADGHFSEPANARVARALQDAIRNGF